MDDLLHDLYRNESRRVFSTLVRLLGSFDVAEEALHDAFTAAAEQWPTQGVPANPTAWLVSTGRFKGIDRIRRDRRLLAWEDAGIPVETLAGNELDVEQWLEQAGEIEDDRLRLIFTCCHPSLTQSAQIALTLREVCGMTTEAIADAFLLATPTLAQRIVRAKAKIKAAGIPYEVPGEALRPARLSSVLRVVYLVFNEGQASHNASLIDESIRLARLLRQLIPEPEVIGLLALLILHDARREARRSASGEVMPLEEQDRSVWNHTLIAEGSALAQEALSQHGFGAYSLQAAIAALHGEADSLATTDWNQIIGIYDVLLRFEPSPVIALNRAVSIAMRDGPEASMDLIAPLLEQLPGYHPAFAAAADLCRRCGRIDEACQHYRKAISLIRHEPERRYLHQRLSELVIEK